MPAKSQNQYAQGLHEEAPHDTEGVRFAKEIDITAASNDGRELKPGNHIN